jgi:hypothetical protein
MEEDPDDLAAAFFAAQAAKEQQKAKLPTEDWINAITTMQPVNHGTLDNAASWLVTTIPNAPDQCKGTVGIELNSNECHSFNLLLCDDHKKSELTSSNDLETAKEKIKQVLVQKLMQECNSKVGSS